MTCKEAALDYVRRGFSVIPVGKDKRPLIEWKVYQSRRPLPSEIEEWFTHFPAAQVGIVTGAISNLSVIDVDNDAGKKKIAEILGESGVTAPLVLTPRGGMHIYCQYHRGLGNNTRRIEGVDLRSEGGFVVAPDSARADGKRWMWDEHFNLDTVPIPPLPQKYIDAIQTVASIQSAWEPSADGVLEEGHRNDGLFHILWTMALGGEREGKLYAVAHDLGKRATPPLTPEEIDRTLKSVSERASRPEKSLGHDVREWIESTTGEFSVKDLRRDLGIVDKKDRNLLNQILHRLKVDGTVTTSGQRDGIYRRIDLNAEAVDWQNAPTDPLNIDWPLDIGELVNIYSKNLIGLAGCNNVGKSALLLDIVKRNMDKWEIHYFTSEMSDSEAKVRITLHQDLGIYDWKFKMWDRAHDWSDVIRPDAMNIVDYIATKDGEEYKAAIYMERIWEKLNKGIAICAIQKKTGCDVGRGGERTMDKSRLYMAVDHGLIKIVKAKNWKTTDNPNGLVRRFKLVQGWKFITDGPWASADAYAEADKLAGGLSVVPPMGAGKSDRQKNAGEITRESTRKRRLI